MGGRSLRSSCSTVPTGKSCPNHWTEEGGNHEDRVPWRSAGVDRGLGAGRRDGGTRLDGGSTGEKHHERGFLRGEREVEVRRRPMGPPHLGRPLSARADGGNATVGGRRAGG